MGAVSRHAPAPDSLRDQSINMRQRFTNISARFAYPFISHQHCSPSASRTFSTTSVSSSVDPESEVSNVVDISFEAIMFSREVLQVSIADLEEREYSIVVYDYMKRIHANAIAKGEHNQMICPSSEL